MRTTGPSKIHETRDLSSAIQELVRRSVHEFTEDRFLDPEAAEGSPEDQLLSRWYADLNLEGKHYLREIVSRTVDETIFGFLQVMEEVADSEKFDGNGKEDLCFVVTETEEA